VDIAAIPKQDALDASRLEESLGEVGYYYLLLNYKLVDQPQQFHRLDRLGARISHYSERPQLKYRYTIIDSQFHLAYSFPPANIVFSTAMLDALKTDEKISAVMAHEIAHINHKHGTYFYEQKYGNKPENASGEKVLSIATQLGYNRAFELQSDQTAMRYLKRSGLDPNHFIDALLMLADIEKKDEALTQKLVQNIKTRSRKIDKYSELSYPHLETRIVNCRNLLDEIKSNEKVLYKPEDFKF